MRGRGGLDGANARIGTVDERLGAGEQGRLVALQRKRIVCAGGKDGARGVGTAVTRIGGDDGDCQEFRVRAGG